MILDTIIIDKTPVSYFIFNSRGHYLRLKIKDGQVYLYKPMWVSKRSARKFLESKSSWLRRNLNKENQQIPLWPLNKVEVPKLKRKIIARLNYFNKEYNFNWNRVSIRHQTTRWGSCSPQGNLNFNSRLAGLPPELQDYIIVHELCHLGVANHSPKFWATVERSLPDYLLRRQALKRYRLAVVSY